MPFVKLGKIFALRLLKNTKSYLLFYNSFIDDLLGDNLSVHRFYLPSLDLFIYYFFSKHNCFINSRDSLSLSLLKEISWSMHVCRACIKKTTQFTILDHRQEKTTMFMVLDFFSKSRDFSVWACFLIFYLSPLYSLTIGFPFFFSF